MGARHCFPLLSLLGNAKASRVPWSNAYARFLGVHAQREGLLCMQKAIAATRRALGARWNSRMSRWTS
jgi:hypothetical protein